MTTWTGPALLGMGIGLLVLLILLRPVMSYQRRAFGRVHLTRIAILGAVCIYAATLFAYTVVPSPGTAALCLDRSGGKLQLIPGLTLIHLQYVQDQSGTWAALTSFALWQLAMNIVLFVPLGIFLRSLLPLRTRTVVLIGAGLSLLIEATQLTGIWGIYSCGIRVADVEDLMANTVGTFLGALIGPWILGRWIPRAHQLKAELRRRVGLEADDEDPSKDGPS